MRFPISKCLCILKANLLLKAADLFKYAWAFSEHQRVYVILCQYSITTVFVMFSFGIELEHLPGRVNPKTERDFLQSNFIETKLRHGCSPVNLLHFFRKSFTKNTSGRLLLATAMIIFIFHNTLLICIYCWNTMRNSHFKGKGKMVVAL